MASENYGKTGKLKVNKTVNSFANDGSFLEMYKQRLKEQQASIEENTDVKAGTEKRKTTNALLQV